MWRSVAIGIVLAGVLPGCGAGNASGGSSDLGALTELVGPGSGGGNPAPSTVITTSSLGGITLGEARARVDAVLGGGSSAPPVDGLTVVGYPAAAMVVTFQNGRVFSIATADARYRTAQGMGVGSPVGGVRKLGNASCVDLGNGAFDCKVDDAGGSGHPPLIDFQGDTGKVKQVEVQSVNE